MWKFELFYRLYSAHTIHSVLNAKMYFQKFYWFHLLWHFRQIWFDLEVFFLILSKSLGIHQTDANIYIFNIIFFSRIVTCKICNYSAYKQSEHCKASNHFVKVVKAKKRFFECKSCKNRTYSFDKLPKHACSKCQSSTWIRTGMIREKKGPLLGN